MPRRADHRLAEPRRRPRRGGGDACPRQLPRPRTRLRVLPRALPPGRPHARRLVRHRRGLVRAQEASRKSWQHLAGRHCRQPMRRRSADQVSSVAALGVRLGEGALQERADRREADPELLRRDRRASSSMVQQRRRRPAPPPPSGRRSRAGTAPAVGTAASGSATSTIAVARRPAGTGRSPRSGATRTDSGRRPERRPTASVTAGAAGGCRRGLARPAVAAWRCRRRGRRPSTECLGAHPVASTERRFRGPIGMDDRRRLHRPAARPGRSGRAPRAPRRATLAASSSRRRTWHGAQQVRSESPEARRARGLAGRRSPRLRPPDVQPARHRRRSARSRDRDDVVPDRTAAAATPTWKREPRKSGAASVTSSPVRPPRGPVAGRRPGRRRRMSGSVGEARRTASR